jgi:hypothetical protein
VYLKAASYLQIGKKNWLMRNPVLLILLLSAATASAQTRLGVFAGIANYQGDLVDGLYASPRAAFGVSANFSIGQRLSVRTGLTFAKVAGADSLNSSADFKNRNLSFQSPVTELSLMAEYNLFNLDNLKWTPYVFAGVAGYHFNPYTYDGGRKVYLQPLGTEGQGIAGYDSKPYSLNGFAIPFGGGVKYMLSDKVQLGLEAGLRKLFTDYLDDVSGTYADATELLQARGQQAVDISFRGDEVPGGPQIYPSKLETRGSLKSKDYYYFTGLHLTFEIGEGLFSGRGKKGYGCPANVF